MNPLQGEKICLSISQALLLFAIHLLFCLQAYSLTSRGEFSLFSYLCPWNTINFFLLCKWTQSMLLNSIAQCSITPCSLSFSLFPPTANFSTMIFPFLPQSDTSFLTNLPQLSPSSPSYPLSSLSLFSLSLMYSSLLHPWRDISSLWHLSQREIYGSMHVEELLTILFSIRKTKNKD